MSVGPPAEACRRRRRGVGADSTAAQRTPPRRARAAVSGGATASAVVALVWALFPIVFIVSAAHQPRRHARRPPSCSHPDARRPTSRRAVQRRGAALHVLVQELADHRRRRLARARSSSAPARRTPSPGCASPAVARACSHCCCCRCSRRCWPSSRCTSPSRDRRRPAGDRPQQRVGPASSLPRRARWAPTCGCSRATSTPCPRELDEAAKVDGASHARIFFTMTLRLVMPILVTVFMLVVRRPVQRVPARQHLPARRRQPDPRRRALRHDHRQGGDKNRYFGQFAAGALLASLPVVLLYLGLPAPAVGGLTQGSVK